MGGGGGGVVRSLQIMYNCTDDGVVRVMWMVGLVHDCE